MFPRVLFLLLLSSSKTLADPFWITAELLTVDWREGCLTTGGCAQPRFKVLEDMSLVNEKMSISWPVSEHFVQNSARQFVSHWATGAPADVSLSCQVVGTDPTYGFPRVCDQTPSVRLVEDSSRHVQGRQARAMSDEEERGRLVVEVRGKCFNATLAVQAHTQRCPWCADPNELAVIGNEVSEDSLTQSLLRQLRGDDPLVHFGFFLLALVALAASAAFGCVLVAYLRQKRGMKAAAVVKPRFTPYQPRPDMLKTDGDESRYDMPWEQKRPLAYYHHLATAKLGSEATTTSPLDSASSLGAPFSYRTSSGAGMVPPLPQTRLYHVSPNSSVGAHDDSGLESV